MIITPATFEDEYNKIGDDPEEVFRLMCDTLEYLGYGATIKRIRDDQ